MLLQLIAAIAPHEQLWGESEGTVIVVLLGVAVFLTLVVAGIFAFIILRKPK